MRNAERVAEERAGLTGLFDMIARSRDNFLSTSIISIQTIRMFAPDMIRGRKAEAVTASLRSVRGRGRADRAGYIA